VIDLGALPAPEVPFNPVIVLEDERLKPLEVLTTPLGLFAFLPLIPLLRLVALRNRHAALLIFPAIWLFATLGPLGSLIFVSGCLVGVGWVGWLGRLRSRGQLSQRGMIAGVWIGLNLLVLPLWWKATWDWVGWIDVRAAVFHSTGFAYVLLRLIAWGVDWARQPEDPPRWWDSLCWLFYPPSLRNGPFLRRGEFLERYDAWDPKTPIAWAKALQHFGWLVVGGIGLGVCIHNLPRASTELNFFDNPDRYSTQELISAVYFVPILVYFLLWTYNALAEGMAVLVGIRVDPNFNQLPLATSSREFWRRWNVTVGAWLRDYIYIPLGGKYAWPWVVMGAAFGYCGIWHGAAWSFVVWPIVPVVAITIERVWDGFRKRRGWRAIKDHPVGRFAAWAVAMHMGMLTVLIFADFRGMSFGLLGELFRRAGIAVGLLSDG
jgi:D-alanyl-lipoteichoic acid acyltransferase DltB (MBOAT superfamily)